MTDGAELGGVLGCVLGAAALEQAASTRAMDSRTMAKRPVGRRAFMSRETTDIPEWFQDGGTTSGRRRRMSILEEAFCPSPGAGGSLDARVEAITRSTDTWSPSP
jgi:hypothetical protein